MAHVSLSAALADRRSPVRRFFTEQFGAGLRDVQRRYRESVPEVVVPPAGAPAGTVAVAADWLLRFMLYPAPDLDLVMAGVRHCVRADVQVRDAVTDLTGRLGMALPIAAGPVQVFTGPITGNTADPALLARACWVFALLTEAYRSPAAVRAASPLSRLRGRAVTAGDLLALAPEDGLTDLAGLRAVFCTRLLPELATRPGRWALGPVFAGSRLLAADTDLVASGLLLRLKVSVHPRLAMHDVFQLIAYPLLDFPDEYQIRDVGLFSGRTGHLATWNLQHLLDELARQQVSIPAARADLRALLGG